MPPGWSSDVRIVCGSYRGRRGPVEEVAARPVYLDVSVPGGKRKTLAVETTNLNNKTGTGGGFFSDAAVLTEKFRRIAKDELSYDLTVNDPKTWTKPFTIHMPYKEDPSYKIYEYACHEGNYMMIDSLTGARALEKEGVQVKVDNDNFVRKAGEAPKK